MVLYVKKHVTVTTGKKLKPKGFVFHETATPNATALNEYAYVQRTGTNIYAHIYVDHTQAIEFTDLTNECYHACSPANGLFCGLEMCHFDDAVKFTIIYDSAAEIIANKMYWNMGISTITKDNCMSHNEVTRKWHNGTHTDPVSYFAKYGKTADMFRARVQYYIDEIKAKQNK
jgi:N-acetylmuramoyl-L-alanine amidase